MKHTINLSIVYLNIVSFDGIVQVVEKFLKVVADGTQNKRNNSKLEKKKQYNLD